MNEEIGKELTDMPSHESRRCVECDSVIAAGNVVCLMCGAAAPGHEPGGATAAAAGEQKPAGREADMPDAIPDVPFTVHSLKAVDSGAEQRAVSPPDVFESRLVERQSRIVFWMTGVVFVVTAMVGSLVLRHGGPVQIALLPSPTPIPATPTLTPSATLQGTATGPATESPSMTPEASQTFTPQPARVHQVAEGETLFGLAYIYSVSMEVIAALNGFTVETPIQAGQTLQVPWPTATPQLEPIVVEINGEPVIADPSNCERYEIQEGDALSVIAARNNINFDLLLQVNRLTDQSIMQPGDTVCIPEVVYGEVLPPTPGPSPTPSATSFPPGPALLYPTDGIVVEMSDEPIVLQWLAVKDLASEEWYMVELTDLDVEGQHPLRAFTRDNAFRVPGNWRPPLDAYHDFRWRISIVTVTGQRDDGGFIYTFGGRFSEDGKFRWQGAVPTATPTATHTPTSAPS